MASFEKFKLTAVTWESDKNPNGFLEWIESISSVVRTTPFGAQLEQFIDELTGRNEYRTVTVPSCILDNPDFDLPVVQNTTTAPAPADHLTTGTG